MLVTIVSGAGEVLQCRFLLVKVVKGLIPLHSERKESNYGCLIISRTEYFCAVYLTSKFSSYFLLRSLKAMQLLSLLTSFLLFIRASLVKKKININNNIKATKQNKSEQENGTLIETDKTEQTWNGTSRCLFWSKDSHVRLPRLL